MSSLEDCSPKKASNVKGCSSMYLVKSNLTLIKKILLLFNDHGAIVYRVNYVFLVASEFLFVKRTFTYSNADFRDAFSVHIIRHTF